MKRKILAFVLSAAMMVGILSGCGTGSETETNTSGNETNQSSQGEGQDTQATPTEEKDVVTALLPPVSGTYQEKIMEYVDKFNEDNPNIEIQVTTASWEDMTQKLDIQVNAGSPPDIAFVGADGISKYLDLGMIIDLNEYLTDELSDFDDNVLNYFHDAQVIIKLIK